MGRPEDSRVKIPALVHFTRLGYRYVSIKKLVSGKDYDRDTNIFYSLFREALERINACTLEAHAFRKIVEELKTVLGNNDLGRAFFDKLQRGHDGFNPMDFAISFPCFREFLSPISPLGVAKPLSGRPNLRN